MVDESALQRNPGDCLELRFIPRFDIFPDISSTFQPLFTKVLLQFEPLRVGGQSGSPGSGLSQACHTLKNGFLPENAGALLQCWCTAGALLVHS